MLLGRKKALKKRAIYRLALRLHAPKGVENNVLLYMNKRPQYRPNILFNGPQKEPPNFGECEVTS